MGDKTGISWTESTWNPIRGRVRVSEGCRHCYAEIVAARFSGEGQPYEGLAKWVDRPGGKREARWTGKAMLVEGQLQQPLRWGRPRMVFVNSTSDLFFEAIEQDWTDRIYAVMALAEKHTFQVLTKRPERMRAYLQDPNMPARVLSLAPYVMVDKRNVPAQLARLEERLKAPLPNVWWGVSAEDQKAANERVPYLLTTPAAVRFVSYEPAIGPIDFTRVWPDHTGNMNALTGEASHLLGMREKVKPLDWIIIGGESVKPAADARPFKIEWAYSLIAACEGTTTAVYVKQLGSRPTYEDENEDEQALELGGKADVPAAWPVGLDVQQYPEQVPHD